MLERPSGRSWHGPRPDVPASCRMNRSRKCANRSKLNAKRRTNATYCGNLCRNRSNALRRRSSQRRRSRNGRRCRSAQNAYIQKSRLNCRTNASAAKSKQSCAKKTTNYNRLLYRESQLAIRYLLIPASPFARSILTPAPRGHQQCFLVPERWAGHFQVEVCDGLSPPKRAPGPHLGERAREQVIA